MIKYVENFLSYLRLHENFRPATILRLDRCLRPFVDFCHLNLISSPSLLTDELVSAYLSTLPTDSGWTHYNYYHSLKKLLSYYRSPVDLPNVSPPKKLSHQPDSLPDKLEIHSLLTFVPTSAIDYRDRAIINLLYYSGIKLHHLSRLSLSQIDYNSDRIIIKVSSKRVRIIPLSSRAKSSLQAYVLSLPYPLPPLKPMFVNILSGRPITSRQIQRIITNRGIDLNFRTALSPAVIRACLERDLREMKASEALISFLLGHSSSSLVHPDRLNIMLPEEIEFHSKLK